MEMHSEKLAALRERSSALEKELATQKESNYQLRRARDLLKLRMMDEAFFHTTVSGFLSTVLWKVSMKNKNARAMMSSDKVENFYAVGSEALGHFVDAFRYGMPEPGFDLAQLSLALCGCFANMASTTDGARNIMTNLYGKNFLNNILRVLPLMPLGFGDRLQWVLFLFLNNMSLNGFLSLKNEPIVVNALVATVSRRRIIQELTPLALRMIEYLTSDMSGIEYMMLKNVINVDVIELWTHSGRHEIRLPALKIMENFTQAYHKFEAPSRPTQN